MTHTEELMEEMAVIISAGNDWRWPMSNHLNKYCHEKAGDILVKLKDLNYQRVLRVGEKMTKGKNGMEIGGVQYCEPIEL